MEVQAAAHVHLDGLILLSHSYVENPGGLKSRGGLDVRLRAARGHGPRADSADERNTASKGRGRNCQFLAPGRIG